MAKKNANAMVKVFELVIAVITSAGILIKAIAELIDYLNEEEE